MINENYVKWGEKKCIKQLYYIFSRVLTHTVYTTINPSDDTWICVSSISIIYIPGFSKSGKSLKTIERAPHFPF